MKTEKQQTAPMRKWAAGQVAFSLWTDFLVGLIECEQFSRLKFIVFMLCPQAKKSTRRLSIEW